MPTKLPPQPPTIKVTHSPPERTGKVKPQKKSLPLIRRASNSTGLALAFAWGVEFSQLYHAPWIDAIRATLPGRLVLGSTFNWPDLPAYAVGVGLGAWSVGGVVFAKNSVMGSTSYGYGLWNQ